MKLLLDTHVAIWADVEAHLLSARAVNAIEQAETLTFSVVSVWEMVIKAGRGRADFLHDPYEIRLSLLDAGYDELPINADHVLEVANLPRLHGDPFDRLLLAQARREGLKLLTADTALARYGAPVMLA